MPLLDKVTIEALVVTPEISNVPVAATPLDDAIAPEPVSANVPAEIVVVPL